MPNVAKLHGGARASPSDPRERARTASRASLHYVSCREAGIRRVKRGKTFIYLLPNGKRLVDAHDGTVRIESNQPRGAVFVVTIPVKRATIG